MNINVLDLKSHLNEYGITIDSITDENNVLTISISNRRNLIKHIAKLTEYLMDAFTMDIKISYDLTNMCITIFYNKNINI